MMSKEKRRVPKLRFPGFTEDWEQCKFGDLFEYERPDAYIVKSDNYNNDFNMPVLTANKAFILGYTNEENSYNKPSIIFDDFTLDRKYVDFPYMLKSSAIKILISKNQHNLRFLFERLNSTRFEVLGHARHYISVVQNTTTLCPSVDEEVCISNLLTKFDELITLHQRKLDNLKLKKKALLQKLFPKNGERYPELRFPGFTDAWEQRKLSDISTKVTTKNVDVHYTETLTNSAEQGIISQADFFDKEISNKDNINGYYIVENNDFIYNPRISTLAPVGPINRNKLNRTGIMSPLYTVFRASKVDLGFLEWYFQSNHWHRYMKLNGDSGARADRIAIKDSTFFEMPIKTPVNIKEQVLIGETLEKFNQYITLHQRKLDNLKLKKKALLQKLFPKNGERYPELRFPGFTDAWEQRKLGNIVDFLDGQRKPLKESERTKGKYPYYGASGIIDYINDYLFDENLVLLSEDGANIIDRNYPVCFIATGKYWVNNHAHVLKVKTGVIDKFICESLERLDYTKFNTGTAQPKLNQDICQKIVITIPNEDEQKCISEFLDRINNIITLHQRKLNHLQLQKKALLQQMFV